MPKAYNPFVSAIEDQDLLDRLAGRPKAELALMAHIYTTMFAMANQDDPHATPSPSGIHGCRLKQWFGAKALQRTNPIPPASYKKMETGRHIETFWREVIESAGFDWEECPESIERPPFKGGTGDGILTIRTEECAQVMGQPVGTRGLLELKDLGIWSFLDYVYKGAQGPDIMGYYHQAQTYMSFYDLKFAVLLGGQADNSAITFTWSRMRKKKGMPPPFWLEILEFDPIMAAKDRGVAQEINYFVENYEEPPGTLKDFDPAEGKFPCGSEDRPYCGWRDICLKVRK